MRFVKRFGAVAEGVGNGFEEFVGWGLVGWAVRDARFCLGCEEGFDG